MRRSLLLAVLAAVAVAGCGGDSSSSSGAAPGNATDRAFVAAMIPHHEAAVAMARVAQREAEGAYARRLAADIMRTQTAEIAELRRLDAALADAGVAKGDLGMDDHAMGMEADAAALAGRTPFDRAFFAAMVPHHEGAIAMARTELAKGASAKVKALAEAVVTAQGREVDEMREQLGGGMDAMHSGHG